MASYVNSAFLIVIQNDYTGKSAPVRAAPCSFLPHSFRVESGVPAQSWDYLWCSAEMLGNLLSNFSWASQPRIYDCACSGYLCLFNKPPLHLAGRFSLEHPVCGCRPVLAGTAADGSTGIGDQEGSFTWLPQASCQLRAQLGCPPEHVYVTSCVACSSQNMVVGFQEGASAK